MTIEREMDRIIEDLRPSKRYIIRVRAINEFGQPSNWSDALEYITPGDNSIPAPPTNLVIDFTSPDMIARWTSPDFNADGSIMTDFSHFRVTIQAVGGAGTAVFDTSAPRFTLPYYLNIESFGSPQPALLVSVRAIDNTGQSSESLVGTATNPAPPSPSSAPSVVPGFTMVNVSMDSQDIPDFDHFELHHSTNGTTYTILPVRTGDTNYTHAVSQGTTHYYKYKIVDKFNQPSPNFSPVATVTAFSESVVEDEDPPNIPTNFRITDQGFSEQTNAYTEFAWDAAGDTGSGVAYYELRYKPQASTVFSSLLVGNGETDARVENLQPDTLYHAKIRAVDNFGNASDYSTLLPFNTDSDTVAPAVPANLRTTSGIQSIAVVWDPNTESDFGRYELHGVANNATFTPSAANLLYTGNGTAFVLHGLDQDDVWYFTVRAVDVYDNASAYSAKVSESSTATLEADTIPPDTPDNVIVTNAITVTEQISRASVYVDWDPNTEEDLNGYELGIKKNADTVWTTYLIPKSNTSHAIDNLLPSTTYNVRLAAYDVSGNTSVYFTTNTTTGTDNVAPSAVTNLVVTPFIRSALLTWDASLADDLSHYNVHVGQSAVFTPTAANRFMQTNATTATVNKYWNGTAWADMVAGQTYYFKITAEDRTGNVSGTTNSSGIPEDINADAEKPNAPTGLSISAVDDLLSVSFTGVTSDVTSYEVWASYETATDDYILIAEIDPSELDSNIGTILDQNVISQGFVYYRVYAVNQGVKSDPLSGSFEVTRTVSEAGVNFVVEPMATSFIMTYKVPDDRLLEYLTIRYEARPTNTGFNFANSVEIYRGVTDSYIHEIEASELEYYHQFWLTAITRS